MVSVVTTWDEHENTARPGKHLSLSVACPVCLAKPGEPCVRTLWVGTSHWSRIVALTNTPK